MYTHTKTHRCIKTHMHTHIHTPTYHTHTNIHHSTHTLTYYTHTIYSLHSKYVWREKVCVRLKESGLEEKESGNVAFSHPYPSSKQFTLGDYISKWQCPCVK